MKYLLLNVCNQFRKFFKREQALYISIGYILLSVFMLKSIICLFT